MIPQLDFSKSASSFKNDYLCSTHWIVYPDAFLKFLEMNLSRYLPQFGIGLLILCLVSPVTADSDDLEALINERFSDIPLTPDNRLRLAAWSELKGDYSESSNTLTLTFGDIAKLEVYQHNFLLRLGNNRVFHLDRRRTHPRDVHTMNESLRSVFEQISLLANHNADPALVYFVDEHLAKKNLEPFAKLYLRHILIKFGRFNPGLQMVEFKTDWLPIRSYEYEMPGEDGTVMIKKPIDPLVIKLDEATVRGYYLKSGGTVYVEDVIRDVFYATGSDYSPNVSAFKIFLQKLFTQTTNYVVKEEEKRIQIYQALPAEETMPDFFQSTSIASTENTRSLGQSRGQSAPTEAAGLKPLYTRQDWMSKMLGLLRLQNAVIDPDVADFLMSQPFFDQLYRYFTREEKAYYDRIMD